MLSANDDYERGYSLMFYITNNMFYILSFPALQKFLTILGQGVIISFSVYTKNYSIVERDLIKLECCTKAPTNIYIVITMYYTPIFFFPVFIPTILCYGLRFANPSTKSYLI